VGRVRDGAAAGSSAAGHRGAVPRVLIADDDRAIRESLARALELEGYDTVTVADGIEALTRSRRAPSTRSWST
jgi:ActR/RegA family two-component response regulator